MKKPLLFPFSNRWLVDCFQQHQLDDFFTDFGKQINVITTVFLLCTFQFEMKGQNPGGASVAPRNWYKTELGNMLTNVSTNASRNLEQVGTANVGTANAEHNFYPYMTGFSSTSYIRSRLAVPGADYYTAIAGSWVQNPKMTMFAVGRVTGNGGHLVGLDNDWTFASEFGLKIVKDGASAQKLNRYNYSSGGDAISTLGATKGSNAFFGLGINDVGTGNVTVAGDAVDFILNGQKSTSNIASSIWTPHMAIGYDAFKGSAGAGTEEFEGDMNEVLMFDSYLSPADVVRISTYLALKYGVTLKDATGLATNYVLSNGTTTVWNTATNANYNNNIAGIVRDDNGVIDQRQAANSSSSIVAIANTVFAASNSANTNQLPNNTALMWGSNAGSATFETPFVFSGMNNRMTRIYKVQETGTGANPVGTVEVAIARSAVGACSSNVQLIISADNNITGSDQLIAMSLKTIGGVEYYTTTVDLTDGQYFTFGGFAAAPGGVLTGLDFWLNPAVNVTKSGTTITGWSDADGGGNNPALTQATAILQPAYSDGDAASNYNPYVNFTNNQRLNTTVTGANYSSNTTTFGVVSKYAAKGGYNNFIRFTNEDNSDAGLHNWGLGTSDLAEDKVALHYISAPFAAVAPGNIYNRLNGSKLFALNTPTIFSASLDGTTGSTAVGNNGNEAYGTGKSGIGTFVPSNFLTVGGGNSFGMNNNKMSEILHFSRELTIQERQKIQTYLAIKYGITLDSQDNNASITEGSYLLGDGTVIWDYTANTIYHNNVTGIGIDKASCLNQKQSKSVNPESFVTLGNGTGIAANNGANANAFTGDKSFDIIGDNGLTKDYAVSYTPASFTPVAPFYRMNRVWKVQETTVNPVGLVTISIPGTTERLLVSSSNTFGMGTQEIVMTPDGNGNSTAQVDLTNGQFFTFGKSLTAPGCVVAGLQYWFDAAVTVTGGANVTSWTDKNSGITLNKNNVGTITTSPGDAKSNFNPYVLFPANAHLTNTINPTALGRLHTTFVLAQKDANIDATYNHAFRFGNGPGSGVLHDFGVGTALNGAVHNPVHHWLSKGTTINRFNSAYPISFGQVGLYGARINSATATGNKDVSFNGNTVTFSDIITGDLSANMQIGGSVFGMQGRIPEVAYYNVSLSDVDRNKVDSYFGIKYGLTLTHNYLSGLGTTIYNIATFGKNITGIGREDCQDLKQKQSKSVEADALITLGIDGQITTTNTANTGAFDTDKSFLIIGDNGIAAGTLTNVTPGGACTPPETVDKFTSRIWKSVESGTVESTKLSVDLSSYNFSAVNPVYMQVSSDTAFTSFNNILMVKNGVNYETNYDFTGTQYLRFAGTTALPPANACSGDKTFEWNTFPSYWNWGQTSRTSTFGDTQFAVTITDPNGAIYAPSVYPVGQWWWNHIFIPRYDANGTNNKITTKIVMNKAANKASFEIFDIDEYFGKDVVNVYGKLGGVQVNPKITFPANSPLTVTTSGTGAKISATTGVWDISAYGKAYVNFNSAVDEIIIEYTKDNGWAFKSYQDIRIRNIDIQCKPFAPEIPLADNVYMQKQVMGGTSQKVDEGFTYKLTVTNLDCASKTINILDGLPSGLTFVDSTLATSLVSASVNTYGGGSSLNMTGVVVPPGTSYIYVDAKGSATGTYDNQADFTVGTNSYRSDDPNQVGASNPTPVTLGANRPLANLVITKTVDKATAAQNEVIKYTYKIDNPNATAILTTFQDNLPATTAGGAFKYVTGSLTNIGSAIVVPAVYGGESSLTLRNLSIPASGSLTFTVDANTSTFTSGQTGKNVASVTPDPGTIYRDIPYYSGPANTLIGACVAGTTAPTLSATSKTNTCPTTTADISGLVSSTCPVGSTLEWHTTNTLLTALNKVSTPTTVGAGTYYPTCFDATNACYSPTPTTGVTVTIGLCFSGGSSNTNKSGTSGSSGSGNASTELVPAGGTGPYTYTNGSTDPLCVAPAGATALPSSSNLVITSTGGYTYTNPTTAGTYYFCIKVCDSSTPTPICRVGVYTVTVSNTPAVNFTGSGVSSNTVSQNATPSQAKSGSAATDLVPSGGTPGYVYSNGSSDPLCVAPSGATALPAASNLTVSSTGSYSYTAPATPGTYYFCVKVCDSTLPTPVCSIATYKITVAPPACAVGSAVPVLKN